MFSDKTFSVVVAVLVMLAVAAHCSILPPNVQIQNGVASQNGDINSASRVLCPPDEFKNIPHPSDCFKYYICVFGVPLLMTCPAGTIYSEELFGCVYIQFGSCPHPI